MSDTDELRLIGGWLNRRFPEPVDSDGRRVLDAADEIDRLRVELATVTEQRDRYAGIALREQAHARYLSDRSRQGNE